jgi:hypothetical protein
VPGGLGVLGRLCLDGAQGERQPDQALLRTVVQIALQPPPSASVAASMRATAIGAAIAASPFLLQSAVFISQLEWRLIGPSGSVPERVGVFRGAVSPRSSSAR